MNPNKKKAYAVCSGIALVLALIYAVVKQIFVFETAKELFRGLSDSFLLPAVLLAGVGGLGWIGSQGFFDIISYGTRSFLGVFIKPISADLPKNFYDYREQKNEKGRKWSWEAVAVGLLSLAVSVVFLILYLLL